MSDSFSAVSFLLLARSVPNRPINRQRCPMSRTSSWSSFRCPDFISFMGCASISLFFLSSSWSSRRHQGPAVPKASNPCELENPRGVQRSHHHLHTLPANRRRQTEQSRECSLSVSSIALTNWKYITQTGSTGIRRRLVELAHSRDVLFERYAKHKTQSF